MVLNFFLVMTSITERRYFMNKLKVLRSFINVRWFQHFKNREMLEKHQQKLLANQLSYIKINSPYFRKLDFSKLEDLPIMDKQVMMNHFNELNTVGIDRDKALQLAIDSEKSREFDEKLNGISVGLSSGTSGHRGLFIISDNEIATWAGTILAKLMPKNKIFGNRIAFFLRADNNLYEGTKSRAVDFRYFDILKNMDDHVANLNTFSPTILVAPPSVLLNLSNYVEKNILKINPIMVISVAEVLTHEDEQYLCKTFAQERIYQVYQCTEGFLGYTCECGSFHINEDIVYVEKEYIDDKRFIPIITDCVRSSQPVIRYRLNDILVESNTKCKCGSPCMVIEKIEGRMDDVFIFENIEGKKIQVFPDFISRCVIYVSGIKEYRIVQNSTDKITVYIDNLNSEIEQQIENEFYELSRKIGFVKPVITFDVYHRNLARKMKRVERGF